MNIKIKKTTLPQDIILEFKSPTVKLSKNEVAGVVEYEGAKYILETDDFLGMCKPNSIFKEGQYVRLIPLTLVSELWTDEEYHIEGFNTHKNITKFYNFDDKEYKNPTTIRTDYNLYRQNEPHMFVMGEKL